MIAVPGDPAAVVAAIDAVMRELGDVPDRALGGSAVAARGNAGRVADYLKGLATSARPLPRHAGRPSPGKVAFEIAGTSGSSFNRQNFATNEWCARMLAIYAEWEETGPTGALDHAAAAAEAKLPAERRTGELERENLLLRAELLHLRQELATVRGLIARTGRMP